MPPKTRGTKISKTSKENIGVVEKTKLKGVTKISKPRKALADKTNSASDDNASTEIPIKVAKKVITKIVDNEEKTKRPRRERRLPNRFIENQTLKNLSNSKEVETGNTDNFNNKTPLKDDLIILSPFKTPEKAAESSLIANRPRRVCRLPSKFDDHSVSPNKFIPVGCFASTPIVQSKPKRDKINTKSTSQAVAKQPIKKVLERKTPSESPIKAITVKTPPKVAKKNPVKKQIYTNADTNNNANQRSVRTKVARTKPLSVDKPSPVKKQRLVDKSFSFRVLEEKKQSLKRDNSHLDVYEFTYDPDEEPAPQKKKRKRVAKKKPAKPKTFVFKNNYDQNVKKALAVLKNVVSKKQPQAAQNDGHNNPQTPQIVINDTPTVNNAENIVNNHVSIGIEDIAADIEPMDHHEINYSPVTSPNRGKSPASPQPSSRGVSIDRQYQDPLNLKDCISFFDEPPVASSSMNMSTRKPHETPWRVEFEQLPIKWQVNTYVKPNMTPAVESSFINFDDSKKKHVYTNMVPQTNNDLPEIVENHQPNLKQTSIISFIREVAERSASKKRRGKSVTPSKANSIFEDISNISVRTNKDHYVTPRKPAAEAPENSTPNNDNVINNEKSNEHDKENSYEEKISKKSTQKKNKDGTFFGFDESEDQENVSPVKIDNLRVRALRPRAREVLQEINAVEARPTRAKPLAIKTKIAASSEVVNKMFDEMKSATDAPVFPEKHIENVVTTVEEQILESGSDDSQSVHLFEDIEVVHHLKPTRKSYGKAAKKVALQATRLSSSDSESQLEVPRDAESGEEDDLADLTFTMPDVQQKRRPKKKASKKKNILSKKEKAELDAWAAGFNSMCEDIEEFPLVVE